MFLNKRKQLLVLSGLTLVLVSCNSGSNTTIVVPPAPPAVNISNLQTYTGLFSYTPSQASASANQFAFKLSESTNLAAIQVIFYEQDNCSSVIQEVSSNSTTGITLQAGSYATNASANYALCSNFAIPGYAGCSGLFQAQQDNKMKSLRYIFYYSNGSAGNASFSQCLTNPAIGAENIYNYSANSACQQNSSTCGYSQSYVYNLPASAYQHRIFVSAVDFTGNLGGFNGANEKCNTDQNKPTLPANIQYRALLNGNAATVLNINYYSALNDSFVAQATGPNLVGGSGLSAAIFDTNARVWTGADTNKDCSNWVDDSSIAGSYGIANESTGSYYGGFLQFCSSRAKLYCVAQ
ncbi:MAG: DUF1554 domain-containing protein [Burkholderiales bacterium]|nr:DUF1554 domain-containing protein [Burkholderiales bacterium]